MELAGIIHTVMTITIRPAQPRDLAAVGEMGAALMRVHHAFDHDRFLAPEQDAAAGYGSFLRSVSRSSDAVVLAAVDGDRVVGYVYAALEPLSWKELRGPAGFIHDILVLDEARRHGVATLLMNAAIDWLRQRGAPRVVLWTAARNTVAQSFFVERYGFRETMKEMTLELTPEE
jgi:GNAT superfamily N-acetyltransferase